MLPQERIVFSFFWAACVAVYVYLFEPYGGYMDRSDYVHMVKVMLFPPVVGFMGVFLYKKLLTPTLAEKPTDEI